MSSKKWSGDESREIQGDDIEELDFDRSRSNKKGGAPAEECGECWSRLKASDVEMGICPNCGAMLT